MRVGGQRFDPVTLSQVKNPRMLCGSQIQSERLWRRGSLFPHRTVEPVFVPTTLTRSPCINITYSECVSVTLVMKLAMRKRHIAICGLSACVPYFPTVSHKRHNFPNKVIEQETVLIFYTPSVCKITHSENNLARCYHKCTYVFMWSTRYFCQIFYETWISSTDCRKKFQISHLVKIRPVGTELFHAGRRTDRQTDR